MHIKSMLKAEVIPNYAAKTATGIRLSPSIDYAIKSKMPAIKQSKKENPMPF